MSGDCSSSATITPHVSASKPYLARVYPIDEIRSRTRRGMSTYTFVVISPATTTRPVVISVSQATRPSGSSARTASSTESEIWSATLSGCPSVTDSEVNENERAPISGTLASFVGRTPAHQLPCKLVQRTALEYRADTLGDRQLDPEAPGEIAQHGRRRQPLDHLADLDQRLA